VTRILVAGGGVAGVAAAVSASKGGADVVLAEGSACLAPNKSLLPLLLSGEVTPAQVRVADPEDLRARFGIEVRLGDQVGSFHTSSGVARTRLGRIGFDRAIIATGSRSVLDDVRGATKRGVFTLRSLEDYLALRSALGTVSSIAISGPLLQSLVLAQTLSRAARVSVFVGGGTLQRFTQRFLGAVSESASSAGATVLFQPMDAIVGVDRVEAVMSAGEVHACDGAVILPRSLPFLPPVDCVKGDHGGAVVDESMRTTNLRVFAAGDCAEIMCGSASLPTRLHSSSLAMGEVAGVNAAGGAARASISRCLALELFGVEVCVAGLDADGARRAGLDAVEFDASGEDGEPDTSLVYDRVTLRLYGVQLAGRGALALSDYVSLVVASGASLGDLAYQESPYLPSFNRGRSPISLTAGRALARARG
jgi:NADPH-dependent 2,4-dienoyl-CoA reductase/sulfur reductase-like enzyme